MADRPRLIAPIVSVVMDDGSEYVDVQTVNFDMLSYERYAAAHKWGPAQDRPLEVATFMAWHALKRESLIGDMTYDQFTTAAVSIESRRAEVDPTQPGPEDG